MPAQEEVKYFTLNYTPEPNTFADVAPDTELAARELGSGQVPVSLTPWRGEVAVTALVTGKVIGYLTGANAEVYGPIVRRISNRGQVAMTMATTKVLDDEVFLKLHLHTDKSQLVFGDERLLGKEAQLPQARGPEPVAAPPMQHAAPPVVPPHSGAVARSQAMAEYGSRRTQGPIVWVLWFLTGIVGGHRYYLGDIGHGVLMTLTAGGGGIWWLIDAFLINGRMRSKNRAKWANIAAWYGTPVQPWPEDTIG